MDMVLRWVMVLVSVVVMSGVVYHHAWSCEGGIQVSGEIVVGDSVQEVIEKLSRKDV